MSIFAQYGKYIRLGAQTFQPLGSWPVTQTVGGRGSTGAAQPAVTVPTNVQGFYSKRVTMPGMSTQRSDVQTVRQRDVN
jgi:hypothetical protein